MEAPASTGKGPEGSNGGALCVPYVVTCARRGTLGVLLFFEKPREGQERRVESLPLGHREIRYQSRTESAAQDRARFVHSPGILAFVRAHQVKRPLS